jgi:transcriptional regulator with XRE-family HTH domain
LETSQSALNRYSELAHFLRNRRERMTPKQAGLTEVGRRRTPGLRRGEVAMLAGVSLEWYTYLEQGRHINVSAEVLESLAGRCSLMRRNVSIFFFSHIASRHRSSREYSQKLVRFYSVFWKSLDVLLDLSWMYE